MASRAEVLAYASQHGDLAASQRYGTPKGTIWSWRCRAKQRAARDGTDPPPPSRADVWLAEARALADRYLAGQCVHCGGSGQVHLEPVQRGNLVIRRARTIPCPSCGGPPRTIVVVEHDRDTWRAGLARAGDAGLGWSGDEWARIRAGDEDGRQFTGRGDG